MRVPLASLVLCAACAPGADAPAKEPGFQEAAARTFASLPAEEPGESAAPRATVIIYGAAWCGACDEAEAYLRGRGVSFSHRDVEKDTRAFGEMLVKLRQANLPLGTIPVLDVAGTMLLGFSPQQVDDAMRRAR